MVLIATGSTSTSVPIRREWLGVSSHTLRMAVVQSVDLWFPISVAYHYTNNRRKKYTASRPEGVIIQLTRYTHKLVMLLVSLLDLMELLINI
jgi:hypothetical protein